MKIYNKLVRDKIPGILSEQGKTFTVRYADEEEYKEKLKQKLQEETSEFIEEPSLEELADIFEVFSAIVDAFGYTQDELVECMGAKLDERGAFINKVILQSVEE
jgi:predicted house-cleaning noncanonical NTP pyrophosphatase (MazG superfamily)